MAFKRYAEQFDFILLALILLISGLGLVTIFSISGDEPVPNDFQKQAVWIGCSFLLLIAIQCVDIKILRKFGPVGYGIIIALLLYLIIRGQFELGVRRWVLIPVIKLRLQPSEFAKLFTMLTLAGWMEKWNGKRPGIQQMIIPAMIMGLPWLLILKQPDLGTSLILPLMFLALVFVSGFRVKTMLILGLCILIPGYFAGRQIIKPYQMKRITSFMNPEADPLGAGYQLIQSKIAIGSGGLIGKGFQQGSQSHLNFLPVQNTDFIFAVWAEERGYFGAVLLLVLYVLLILRCLKAAKKSDTYFGLYTCAGITSMLFSQIVINIAMVTGLLPVTGLPLPLMSYGGSACLTYFISLGIVLNIGMRSFPKY
jgi:rod shape determining protein RodA